MEKWEVEEARARYVADRKKLAMQNVKEATTTKPVTLRESTAKPETKYTFEHLVQQFMEAGLSRAGAEVAAKGRPGSFMPIRETKEQPTADELTRKFKALGLSESAAKIAAKGRRVA